MTHPAIRSIPALIDKERLGAFQWRLLALCVLIALLDGFDTQAIAFTGPAILVVFKLPAGALAPILTAGIIGMTVGAMTLGLVGDRIGRRPALMIGLTLFGTATLATSWATDPQLILVLRFIAGLGMGGCTPVLLALTHTPAFPLNELSEFSKPPFWSARESPFFDVCPQGCGPSGDAWG